MDPKHDLLTVPNPSVVGRKTSRAKLNGQVYTPTEIAAAMVSMVDWPSASSPNNVLLDPTCGDGVFLEAAMRKAVDVAPSKVAAEAIIKTQVIGWDIDPEALELARQRLSNTVHELGLSDALPRLEQRNVLTSPAPRNLGTIIGNPPYLESKRMPSAQKELIRQVCPTASHGAFDMYSAVLERCIQFLEPTQGLLCFLIPNRFLVGAYCTHLRTHLLERADIGIVDLSRERIFRNAAVYPIILTASLARKNRPHRTEHWSLPDPATTRSEPHVVLSNQLIRERLGGVLPIAPSHHAGQSFLRRVLTDKNMVRLDRFAKTRWTVSFHRAGLRDRYVFSTEPNSQHARPFLGGKKFFGNREVEAGHINWSGTWIDYDEERARADGNPFPPGELFNGSKIVICQNARRMRCAIDDTGFVLKDTFLLLRPRDASAANTLLQWLVLVLNSDVLHFIYEHIFGGTRKGGQHLHFLPRHLNLLPVPPCPERSIVSALHEGYTSGHPDIHAIEDLVRQAFNVTDAERSALSSYSYPARHA